MSQKEVWKDNRVGRTMVLRGDAEHWLSSIAADQYSENSVADELADRLRQQSLEDREP